MLVESIPGKYRKAVSLVLRTVFEIEHVLAWSMLHVAYMSIARREITSWHQQLKIWGNAFKHNVKSGLRGSTNTIRNVVTLNQSKKRCRERKCCSYISNVNLIEAFLLRLSNLFVDNTLPTCSHQCNKFVVLYQGNRYHHETYWTENNVKTTLPIGICAISYTSWSQF